MMSTITDVLCCDPNPITVTYAVNCPFISVFSTGLFVGSPLCALPLSNYLCPYWSRTHTSVFLVFVMDGVLNLFDGVI